MREGTQVTRFNTLSAAALGAPAHFFFYFTFKYGFHLPYENFVLRLIATLLCLAIILKDKLPAFVRHHFPSYWHGFLIFVLPFIFTVNLIMNNFHELWLYWEIFMLFVLITYVPNWLMFLVDLSIGVFGAVLFYFLSVPHVELHPTFNIPLYSIVLTFTIVAGYLFSYSNRLGLKAMERNTALQALAGGIAHEMRNPLGQIRNNFNAIQQDIERLQEKNAFPLIATNGIEKICQSALQGQMAVNRGIQIIDMILEEVKDEDSMQNDLTCFSITALTRKAIDEYSYESNIERDKVHFHYGDDFTFRGAESIYIFVLFNLIMNALYFLRSNPAGRIDIRLQRGESRNRVIIRDNGPGIAKEILGKIFDPFFTSRKKGGTGLGLTFCKRVMHSCKGDITCNSEYGEFTEFILSFPVLSVSEVASYESQLYAEHREFFSGKKLLLVDDDPENLLLIRRFLAPLAVTADEAVGSAHAMTMIDSGGYNLLFANLDLPGFDGYELAYRIRESGKVMPIVGYTKEPLFMARSRGEQSGIQGLLSMPLVLSEVLQGLTTALKATNDIFKGSFTGKVVLIVDDSAVNLLFVKSLLQQLDLTVMEASNGEEALDILNNHHCDLMLTDIQMPVLDGLETTKHIRSEKCTYRNIPIIGLSGDSSQETVLKAKHYGMNDYLVKPIDNMILLRKVVSLI